MKFNELVEKLGDAAACNSLSLGSVNPEITGVAAVEEATAGSLSYIEGAKFKDWVSLTGAAALILPKDEQLQGQATARGIAWIAVVEPRLLFARTLALFYQPWRPKPGIHPAATIDPSAEIEADVYIGAGVTIGPGVKIGLGACLHPNVVIYPDVEIGANTVLHANCTVHERSRIGPDCTIHSGAVIGGEGFGFVPSGGGWVKMEQSGYVVLESGVDVGSNTTIDRPAVGETRIGKNTKIDNLVQIGHGCHIGENCAIAAQAGLAGGVKVGNNVILAGQVGISNRVQIGDGAIASAKTGIHSDVPPHTIVSGYPAIPNKLWLKTAAIYNRLPEIYQSLKQLQRRLGNESNRPPDASP
ncbi:UDP-3-O-(3-hydroxymyristoyl)glucosamine N-acyltransferase [[Phormidium] sp. ETS-05]|uniref:UDP-3-O-(3-hydroxymyristoyl)glucosamine N-acyltransferase n=1 Tax=[Phormidium] sp. ETS-05 TaxID=222819 RepID=UPI0018EED7E4|nr:UDP-3-O-(3-hydroxymyristoyl)glucosamine N-acyltransferase [[Phormidium] sp. ETS-05]